MPNIKIDIPNYIHIKWSDTTDGDIVWLQGRPLSFPRPYGPFKVVSSSRRILMNIKGNEFMHYAEDIILPSWK